MRWVVISLLALLCSACAQVSKPNSSVIEQLEERLAFDITETDDAMSRAVAFIRDVKRREPKVRFTVAYKTASSEFVANLHDKFKSEGIAKNRYKVVLAEPTQEKNIVMKARYLRIKNSDCGTLKFASRNSYQFGCVVEHNRNLSLVNPVKRVE